MLSTIGLIIKITELALKNNEIIQALLEEMYEVLEGKYEREQ